MNLWQKLKKKSKSIFFWHKTPVMEKQIFNATIVIIGFYLFLMGLFNFFTKQYVLTFISLFAVALLFWIYDMVRVKNKFMKAIYIFGGLAYPLITINFFLNDGIYGPSSYIFILANFVLISISPKKMVTGWTITNLIFFLILFYVGNYYSEAIPTNYSSKHVIFLDHGITYIGSLLGITFLIITIKNFYQIEKSNTEKKKQELVVLNRNLANINNQKDKIIAIIAHDLKNPLYAIMQTLELIADTEEDIPQEEIHIIRSELLKNTKKTIAMMENILEWSSFELNNQKLRIEEVDLKSLLENTLDIMTTIASQKQVELKIIFNNNPTVKLETDRLLLIVRNLVQNAIKFTKPGGKIEFELSSDNNLTTISVEDNGIGIPESKLKDIFQLNIKSTYGTANEKGTGMGLHICYQNAQKLGGEIEVRSTEGAGSSFILRFPNRISFHADVPTR